MRPTPGPPNRACPALLALLLPMLLAACGDRSEPVPAAPAPAPAATAEAPPAAPTPAKEPAMEFRTSADRAPPPRVAPVERDGVRYAQASDGRDLGADTADGVLVASDAQTGQRLWVLTVYRTPLQPGLETDVQWRFFTHMAFDPDGRLRIANEAGQTFLVDVGTRQVTQRP